MAKGQIYRISFHSAGQLYEVHAKSVGQGELFGFVEVEGLLFGERSGAVIDPTEERLKHEFAGVSKFHVPMHAVVRIDEVAKRGANKITALPTRTEARGAEPTPIYTPTRGPKK